MKKESNKNYMPHALALAEKGRYTVSPNPMVGCLIVKDNRVIGTGYHRRAGSPHAEIYALKEAGESATAANVFTTLEPCAHDGKTQPCVNALISARIKKVFIACLDLNPLVRGKGVEALRAAGIEVEIGLCEQEAKKLNEIFFHYIQKNRPFVIAKWAMSLDGKTITHPEDVRQISSLESQQHAHLMRASVDAILVGANTIHSDNPQLTIRFGINSIKQPIRIILTTKGNFSPQAKIFSSALPGKTIIVSTQKISINIFLNPNLENLILPPNQLGQIDLKLLLNELGNRRITSLLVEGGEKTHQSFINENLVNKFSIYIAPIIISTLPKKHYVEKMALYKLNKDFHLTGYHQDEAPVCLVE